MRRIGWFVGTVLAAQLGCGTSSKVANTTASGARTAGTAVVGSAKTVGGTARGAVKGGVPGAREEARTGAANTAEGTRERASQTRAATRGEEPPPSTDENR